MYTKMMHTLGPTRSHAGMNPLQSAVTPSLLTVLVRQSIIPEYARPRPVAGSRAWFITLDFARSAGLQQNEPMKPAQIAVTKWHGTLSDMSPRSRMNCLIWSYELSSAAARIVARATFGPTPA